MLPVQDQPLHPRQPGQLHAGRAQRDLLHGGDSNRGALRRWRASPWPASSSPRRSARPCGASSITRGRRSPSCRPSPCSSWSASCSSSSSSWSARRAAAPSRQVTGGTFHTSLPAWQGRNKILQEEEDGDQESRKQKQDKMSVKQASVFVIGEDEESEDMESSDMVTKSPPPSPSSPPGTSTWDEVRPQGPWCIP